MGHTFIKLEFKKIFSNLLVHTTFWMNASISKIWEASKAL